MFYEMYYLIITDYINFDSKGVSIAIIHFFSSENDRKETQKIQFIEKSRAEKFCK
jgi:hypothetical protein